MQAAREYIKDHLKAPATAIFSKESICARLGKVDFDEAAGLVPTPECTASTTEVIPDKNSVIYRASVDAQNSYGALIRTKYIILAGRNDKKLDLFDAFELVKELWLDCKALNDSSRRLGTGQIHDCDAECPACAKR